MDKTHQLVDIIVNNVVEDFAHDYIRDVYDEICSMFDEIYDVEDMESDEIVPALKRTYENLLESAVYDVVSYNESEIKDSYIDKAIREVCDIPSVALSIVKSKTTAELNNIANEYGFDSAIEMLATRNTTSYLALSIMEDALYSIDISDDLLKYINKNFDVLKEVSEYYM